MQTHEIELWTLNIIDRVEKTQPVEDSRVELKSAWISPEKAARRIAGHANASKGNPLLWVIGLDEENGVIGVNAEEFSEWYNKVKSQFDGSAPFVTSVCVSYNDKTCVALLFESEMAPFVIKNPVFGLPGGGSVELEVPWREGTSVRSANRAELLTLLSPIIRLPKFEVSGGILRAKFLKRKLEWSLRLFLYIEPVSSERVTIPFHKCEGGFSFSNNGGFYQFSYINLEPDKVEIVEKREGVPQSFWKRKVIHESKTIENTFHELLISGPGQCFLNGGCETDMIDIKSFLSVDVRLQLSIVNTNVNLPLGLTLYRLSNVMDYVYYYHWYKDVTFDRDIG